MTQAFYSAIAGTAIGVLAAGQRFCSIKKKSAHDPALFPSRDDSHLVA